MTESEFNDLLRVDYIIDKQNQLRP